MTTIGFVGLGHMGHPMASNLLKARYPLCVYDVKREAMQPLVEAGAKACASIEALTKQSDVILTSVQTGEQLKEVCLSKNGVFAHAKADLIYIDTSSVDIITTMLLHEEAQKIGIRMVDAPVSGGVAGAQAATLTIMVGGKEDNFKKAEPILKHLGKKVIHAGPPGRGQAAKICNNLLLGISMIGVSEAFNLADRLGLDPKKFFEISSNSSGQCWSMTSYCPVPGILENTPASHQYKPGFMAKMMLKDLRLGQHAAEAVDAIIPLGTVATELYELYVNQGNGEMDFSGIINLIANRETGS